MSTISSFKDTKNKHDVYRGKDFMKMFVFYESFREHVIKVIHFLKMKVLAKRTAEPYENAKICNIYRQKSQNNMVKIQFIIKLEIIFTIQVNIEVLHMAYAI